MAQVIVEYVAGPACGQRRTVMVGPSGQPPVDLPVTIPARWASALDEQPIPESTHLYRRSGNTLTPEGPLWQYRHHGPLPDSR